MRLLICAQAVDQNDPTMGFFLTWIEALSKQFEQVTVLCLRRGTYSLPPNVQVVWLGESRIMRAVRLVREAWRLRAQYDAVFVHQGQEFIVSAGWLWVLLHKPVYMWRNHFAGSVVTDFAAMWCRTIFCTSTHSYTAKYKKTMLMPVGVDTERFKPTGERTPGSVLFFARMSPSKYPETLVAALKQLTKEGIQYSATFVGSPLPKYARYYESVKETAKELGSRVQFIAGIPNDQAPALYSAHQVFVNCSPSGMYDKTIFEAAASGCQSLAMSDDWRKLAGEEYYFKDEADLAEKLKVMLARPEATLRPIVESHSLSVLAGRLREIMTQ